MLNATNRTLSANLNRLNLGTRNLANVASLNDGMSLDHRHDAHYRQVVPVRAEELRSPRPSIQPISPKPIGGKKVGTIDRKRESSLGSSVSSQWSAGSAVGWASSREWFAGFGFSAFDLSTEAFSARSRASMRPMPPQPMQAEQASLARARACFARATQPARDLALATSRRSGSRKFLEPSASS